MPENQPLKGLLVLEFSQYLSGPSAGLRLADLGARVIKIERPGAGDACRQLSIKDMFVDDSSLLFHTINRNKESFAANLKDPADLAQLRKLIANADVITHNFRPGVMEKVGLDYASVKEINPRIIYGEITGYGKEGPWSHKPGQDLLLQSVSGLACITGNQDDNPMPFGIAIADILCGSQLVQGILATLIRRQKAGIGAHIEVSLLESLLDFQFEILTTYFTSGKQPVRGRYNSGHALLSAPYGIYQSADGYLAIAMVPLKDLAKALDLEALSYYGQSDSFQKRDEIKNLVALRIKEETNAYWMEQMVRYDLWAIPVMDWQQMKAHEAYRALSMEQEVGEGEKTFTTTRCPIRINGERLFQHRPAPALGAHTVTIQNEMNLV